LLPKLIRSSDHGLRAWLASQPNHYDRTRLFIFTSLPTEGRVPQGAVTIYPKVLP
jgi:hypothetical protein